MTTILTLPICETISYAFSGMPGQISEARVWYLKCFWNENGRW